MALSVYPEEPAASGWLVAPLGEAAEMLLDGAPVGRPTIVAVDGRSGAGKTTVAERLRGVLPAAGVVHIDDVAWYHSDSFFGWVDLLVTGIVEPVLRGARVRLRPPAWSLRGREGAIEVSAHRRVLLIEGVGAGREELAHLVDATIWVQSDSDKARQRGIARDGGDQAAEDFWDRYAAAERPFLAHHRPWEHATLVIAGTPHLHHDPRTEILVAPGPIRPDIDVPHT
ncbi:hypothetical protein [Actinopolymorpha sp. B9G3]|uniref:uridine kinase family protein n=1 Tax=Actinopolymorpha sp. B9G3 TaxID=3158970 RepID=UPI0032D99D57